MLPSGQHYWLNVTPVGNGTGRSFNATTNGTNCVGTPCGNDGNDFFNSTYFGVFFGALNGGHGPVEDYSNGVIGTVVPEPATVALLTCGLGALLIAVRRRRGIGKRGRVLGKMLTL
jgi:PEP-CTERM motif